jgi:hypothetical protein
MLHAIAKKGKSTLYRRYLGSRDGEERKVNEEDEITSTIFGPLDFMPTDDVFGFWQRILESAGQGTFLPPGTPSQITMDMWPKRPNPGTNESIEPDVMVRMTWPDTFRILLIELKWRSPLSGEDQLHKQWQYFLTPNERSQALHLFIAPEISAGAGALNNQNAGGNVWGNRLLLLPWMQIRAVLNQFPLIGGLSRWAKLADCFLERVLIRRFGGFRDLVTDLSLPDVLPSPLFWHPYTFTGWTTLGALPTLPTPCSDALFFTPTLGDK